MAALPSLPLIDGRDTAKATGTDIPNLVPLLVPTPGHQIRDGTTADNRGRGTDALRIAASVAAVGDRDGKSNADTKRAKGLEPSTFSLED
jgi:hypothetical protein